MIEVITPIWQRVLQQSSIGIEDNFFDLGGDSSLALQLFNEIAQACGRELPPVTIYQAPTITALAALLEQPTAPRFPTLILLKDGTDLPPVFIAHGLGGSAMDFYQPVKHIQSSHAIYGIQSRGIDGVDAPFERIEDMAQFYIDEIKTVQPHGPYFLIGYSLGGLVAYEMARRLTANREKVGLLAMLDAYPHMRYLSLAQRLRLIARQAKRGLDFFEFLSGSASYQPPQGVSFSPVMQRVRDSAYLALTRYQPQPYDGKINFVRAAIKSGFPKDPRVIWAGLVRQFEVETVPGDHLGIITTHYGKLAAVLSQLLQGGFADQSTAK
jgi:thioesterase domain-containing protein/acyl carrier protein